MALSILLNGHQTLETIENLLLANLPSTQDASHVEFDLRELESINLYASTILLSWGGQLLHRGIRVNVRATPLSAAAARSLIDSRILEKLEFLGAAVDAASGGDGRKFGVPVEMLDTLERAVAVSVTARQLKAVSGEYSKETIQDFCDGVLSELLENATNHGAGVAAHFGLSIVDPADAPDPAFPSFAAAEKYLEIAVGDLGVGIDASLKDHVPPAYRSPFANVELLPDELTIAYAFEFSSTSDPAGRRDRLRKVLKGDIEHWRVATGLSCVLNIVRNRHAQVVLRTPRAMLSIDYGRGLPVIRTAKALRIETQAPLNGTHFLLRFPARRVSAQNVYAQRAPELLKNTEPIAPFFQEREVSELERLANAVERTDTHLQNRQRSIGITVIEPSSVRLSERAKGVFAASLVTMPRGARHLICLGDYNLSPPIGDPSAYFPPPASDVGVVLEGDLDRNEFHHVRAASDALVPPAVLAAQVKNSEVFALNLQVLARVREVHTSYLCNVLRQALRMPSVRLVNGPFLIEGQYLANVFYSVWELLADRVSDFAAWAIAHVPDDCEMLIASTPPVAALAQEIARLRRTMGKSELEVITEPERASRRDGNERRAVAMTDVIARGNVLDSVVQSLQPLLVQGIIALVDARPEDTAADFFRFTVGGIERDVRLYSITREPIPTFGSIDDARRAHQTKPAEQQIGLFGDRAREVDIELQVKIIDPNTHRPTLYIRAEKQVADSSDKILKAADRGNALVVGHVEHQGRHYAIYLNFPVLFEVLRAEILQWMQRTVSRDRPRHYIVINHDQSLGEFDAEILKIDPEATVQEIDANELRAPQPPAASRANERTIVILPGSASGETARRSIEFASRRRSEQMLVLILIARMEPAHLAFLQSIPNYWESHVQVECFSRFAARAYPNEVSCELCASRGVIRQLSRDVQSGPLAVALDRKLKRLAAVKTEDIDVNIPVTAKDVRRAKVRSIYEAAEYDLEARQELVQELECDPEAIDLFLEIIALEWGSRHFTIPALRRRLLKTYDKVFARVHNILWRGTPTDLGGKMPAILHLAKNDFIPAAKRLIEDFASSPEAFEEICIAIAQARVVPTGVDAFFSAANGGKVAADVALLQSTVEWVKRSPSAGDDAAFVTEIATLWSRLVRSSLVTVRLPLLRKNAASRSGNSRDLRAAALRAYEGWNVEVADLIARLLGRRLWREISARQSTLADQIVALCATMNDIYQLSNGSSGALDEFKAAVQHADRAEEARTSIKKAIDRMFVNPCRAIVMERRFPTESGNEMIHVTFDFDDKAPFIFTDASSLDEAVGQIRENWCKHNAGQDVHARIIIRQEGEFVAIKFEDDVAAPIDPGSAGGVRFFSKFCEDHGGSAEIQPMNDTGKKAIILRLRPDIQRQVQKR
jgi:hypothetical protein